MDTSNRSGKNIQSARDKSEQSVRPELKGHAIVEVRADRRSFSTQWRPRISSRRNGCQIIGVSALFLQETAVSASDLAARAAFSIGPYVKAGKVNSIAATDDEIFHAEDLELSLSRNEFDKRWRIGHQFDVFRKAIHPTVFANC